MLEEIYIAIKAFFGVHLESNHEHFMPTHLWITVLFPSPSFTDRCADVLFCKFKDMPIFQLVSRDLLGVHYVASTSLIKDVRQKGLIHSKGSK